MNRRTKKGRNIEGILPLDKPIGIGSNEVLQVIKRLYRAQKAGHTGSLDQLASGLLPICMGEATKLSGFLLNADKRYRTVFQLGEKTTTGDAEGEILERRPADSVTHDQLERVLAEFRGEIEQIPPMHSALKHKGQRLYKLAQRGVVVEREPRAITIHTLTLLGFKQGRVELDIHCSKGTYIRTLAEDVGEALGCGGHVRELRRTESGPFRETDMVALEQVRDLAGQGDLSALDALLLPMDAALSHWPQVNLPADVAYYLSKGQPVLIPHAPTHGKIRLYDTRQRFLGVGEILDDGRVAPQRLVAKPS
uniref:tRNA pseudouridine synthase B n=1 Tax=Candidatus Kentrum sp. MB TaxID=2138164 RepID=A0A451B8G1_9GAMM|nr:MAG: tRNA pseudouridine synthase B [Candidatus Kentron sp. MB]VFK26521.1 MAG: tRNA pseudouridine synthase B [Candidatus Kentron sp. MB]VFK74561.1 MAG: tRNA pseudouridine synthase B [Candidatus Kentron sp. MB]